ncbi:hypothetical protein KU6B_20380 [Mameliella alba]|nr:hypothetical protein KU6B_20380 [Mameliella alba]GGF54046.1 hypothetical protein GCM10011319_14320 [Mameliella alba]
MAGGSCALVYPLWPSVPNPPQGAGEGRQQGGKAGTPALAVFRIEGLDDPGAVAWSAGQGAGGNEKGRVHDLSPLSVL